MYAKKDHPLFVAKIWNNKRKIIKLKLEKDYFITYPKRRSREVKLSIIINEPIKKKFKKNDSLGLLKIVSRNGFKKEYPLLASEDFKEVNFIKKFFNSINFLNSSISNSHHDPDLPRDARRSLRKKTISPISFRADL